MTARAKAWVALIALLSVGRLLLTGDRDILAVNGPYDEYWYVSTALRLIWGGEYNHMAFAHLPVYPAWIAAISAFGIPGRLAIDLAWIAAGTYLAFAVWQFTGRGWAGILLFALLVTHPYTISIFDRALAETLLAALSAAVLAAFIEAWNCRNGPSKPRRYLAWAVLAVGFGAAYHTRKEGIVMVAPLLVLLLWSLAKRRSWWSVEGRKSLAYPLLVVPLTSAIVVGSAIALANAVAWGVPARYELATSGYERAMNALYRIDPGSQTPKQVTVTARTRAQAYAASPTFAELRGFFEGPIGQTLAAHTAQYSGVPGEIANGWFYWALRDAAATAGWHRTAANAETKYNTMADELDKAFQSGALPKRTVLVSFIDPDFGKWAGDLPHALRRELVMVIAPTDGGFGSPPEDASPRQFADFVRAFGRRRMPPSTTIAGWITAPEGSQVALGAGTGAATWLELKGATRPDVPGGYPFKLSTPAMERVSHLYVRSPKGTTGSVPLASLRVGHVSAIEGMSGTHVGVDQLSFGETRGARWLGALTSMWSVIGWVLLLAGVAGLGAGAIRPTSAKRAALMLLALAGFAVIARTSLLGLLDASSWNGLQARYVLPVIPAFVTFGVVGAWLVAEAAVGVSRGSAVTRRSSP
jgi:hypothetical protein